MWGASLKPESSYSPISSMPSASRGTEPFAFCRARAPLGFSPGSGGGTTRVSASGAPGLATTVGWSSPRTRAPYPRLPDQTSGRGGLGVPPLPRDPRPELVALVDLHVLLGVRVRDRVVG